MLGFRGIDSLMNVNTKLLPDQGELLEDAETYRRFVRKLNYLTGTRPEITFAVSMVNQFLLTPRTTHLEVIMRILRCEKSSKKRTSLVRS